MPAPECIQSSENPLERDVVNLGCLRMLEENPLAIAPEPEHRAQYKSDHVGADVVGKSRGHIEHVVAQPQAQQRKAHSNTI